VRIGDPAGLAAAALELLDAAPAARRAIGEAARARARERYDAPRVIALWADLLEAAAGGAIASGR
jgi:glycosyltransferase involved in cell wall biosynthesis